MLGLDLGGSAAVPKARQVAVHVLQEGVCTIAPSRQSVSSSGHNMAALRPCEFFFPGVFFFLTEIDLRDALLAGVVLAHAHEHACVGGVDDAQTALAAVVAPGAETAVVLGHQLAVVVAQAQVHVLLGPARLAVGLLTRRRQDVVDDGPVGLAGLEEAGRGGRGEQADGGEGGGELHFFGILWDEKEGRAVGARRRERAAGWMCSWWVCDRMAVEVKKEKNRGNMS